MPLTRLLLLLLLSRSALATHLIGGYIQVQQVPALAQQYTIRVVLFMNEVDGRIAAQQTPTLPVCFGDGSTGTAQRVERVLLRTDSGVSRNVYTVSHTYAGPGVYTATCLVNGRTDGLGDGPNASTLPLGLSTTFSTSSPNNTPVLPLENVFVAAVNQKATLSFRATDAEGDSLIYLLSKPQTAPNAGTCVSQLSYLSPYLFPNEVGQRGTFKLNARSGELIWNAPIQTGRFDFALTVQEWRNGVLLSQTQYEQVIIVSDMPGGTPGTIPPYEPAQLSGGGLITAVADPEDNRNGFSSVFPVPAHERLQVVLRLAQPGPVSVQLIDSAGRIVFEDYQKAALQRYERLIDVHALASGVYVMRAVANGQVATHKVLKP